MIIVYILLPIIGFVLGIIGANIYRGFMYGREIQGYMVNVQHTRDQKIYNSYYQLDGVMTPEIADHRGRMIWLKENAWIADEDAEILDVHTVEIW